MATMDVGLNKTFGWQQWTLNKIKLLDGNNGRWAKQRIWMATMDVELNIAFGWQQWTLG